MRGLPPSNVYGAFSNRQASARTKKASARGVAERVGTVLPLATPDSRPPFTTISLAIFAAMPESYFASSKTSEKSGDPAAKPFRCCSLYADRPSGGCAGARFDPLPRVGGRAGRHA